MTIEKKKEYIKFDNFFPAFKKAGFDAILTQIEEQLDASIKTEQVAAIEALEDAEDLADLAAAKVQDQVIMDKVNEILAALQGE